MRPDPDELLRQVMQAERHARRGRHRIFLGFAAGVGKTVAMLREGHRRRAEGEDVVVGYFEPHGRAGTVAEVGDLEEVPRRAITYRDHTFEEMDTEAIIARRPQVVLVDELAHTNVPGSRHEKRWQDVEEIRDAGIHVLSTLNVQHLESLKDKVEQITGVNIRETLPDHVLSEADEVVLVDLPPEALRQRLESGQIYPEERARIALEKFFRPGNLAALRELALRETADDVDRDLTAYQEEQRSETRWCLQERLLVCVNERPSSATLVRRGARLADRVHGRCYVVYVASDPEMSSLDPEARGVVRQHLNLAKSLKAEVVLLEGKDVARELVRFAREHQVTQIFLGRSSHGRWHQRLRGSIINEVVRLADGIDVHIVADR
jgi:two-component system, OmpR family, sensor histidine kinase KdpD